MPAHSVVESERRASIRRTRLGDEFGRDRESDYCTAAWPCNPYGAVVRRVDEGKDGFW